MTGTSSSFDPRIVLRPRSLDETLDLALAYLRASARDFSRVFSVLVVASLLVIVAASRFFSLSVGQTVALTLVITALLERVVTVYAGRHLFGHARGLRLAVRHTLARLPVLSFSALLLPLPWLPMLITDFDAPEWIGIGTMLGVFWPAFLASQPYFAEALLLEELPAGRAVRRARVLVLYRFSRGLGLVLFSALVRGLFAGIAFVSFQFAAEFVLQLQNFTRGLGLWAAIAGYLMSGPYLALARLFDYVDARTRREGWDIQVRFNAIAARARETSERSPA